MTQLADLFLTEKEKTLILLAIDTHVYSMHQNGCSKSAIDIFHKLEERITGYNTSDATLIMTSLEQLNDEVEASDDDHVWDVAAFVAALTEEDAIDVYEALCERLGDDADEIDLDEKLEYDTKSIKDQLKASLEMEVNPNGPTSTEKLGIKGDNTPWYDRLPCDSEPSDLEGVINTHLRTVK